MKDFESKSRGTSGVELVKLEKRYGDVPALRSLDLTIESGELIPSFDFIATHSGEMRTVEVGIASFHGTYVTNWPYQMAAAVTAVVPIVVLFRLTQRYFVRGIQMTGFK